MPDLLFINYKLIDEVGHVDTMNSVQMRDSIKEQDRDLPSLIRILDEQVGEGRWVMSLVADHGHTPDPESSGASVIAPQGVAAAIQSEFDRDANDMPIVEFTQPTHVFIDIAELEQQGATLDEVSAFLLTVTKGEVEGVDYPLDPTVADERAFLAAYPSTMIEELPCLEGRT